MLSTRQTALPSGTSRGVLRSLDPEIGLLIEHELGEGREFAARESRARRRWKQSRIHKWVGSQLQRNARYDKECVRSSRLIAQLATIWAFSQRKIRSGKREACVPRATT